MKRKILVIDDNSDSLAAIVSVLEHHDYDVTALPGPSKALETALTFRPSVILLDVIMPGATGYELTQSLKSDPELRFIPVILVTAKDTLEEIIFGLDQGADGYVVKPVDPQELLARVRAALRLRDLYEELQTTQRRHSDFVAEFSAPYDFSQIVGNSSKMQHVFSLMRKVASTNTPVLVTGPSGTGKELVARALHFNSSRREEVFVARNCAAFSESLLESELFGHVRGAFTGAIRDHRGVFEIANLGTLFLDELGEMSPKLQAQLLRVLENGVFHSVGAQSEKRTDLRIIGATNKNLARMVEQGTFREDLYYRLNVFHIELPALHERREDIPLLLEHFLKIQASKRKEQVKPISEDVKDVLFNYPWPGNVREFENEIERMLILAQDSSQVLLQHISERIVNQISFQDADAQVSKSENLRDKLDRVERDAIQEALKRCEGNKSSASRMLGISRSNLILKVQQFGLEQGLDASTRKTAQKNDRERTSAE